VFGRRGSFTNKTRGRKSHRILGVHSAEAAPRPAGDAAAAVPALGTDGALLRGSVRVAPIPNVASIGRLCPAANEAPASPHHDPAYRTSQPGCGKDALRVRGTHSLNR